MQHFKALWRTYNVNVTALLYMFPISEAFSYFYSQSISERLYLCPHADGSIRKTTGITLSLQIISIYFSVQGGKFATNPSGFCKCFITEKFSRRWYWWLGSGKNSMWCLPHNSQGFSWASTAQTRSLRACCEHLSVRFEKQRGEEGFWTAAVGVVFAALQQSAWLHRHTSVPSKPSPPHRPVWPDKGPLTLWFS